MRIVASGLLAGLLILAGCAKDDTVVSTRYDADPIDDLVATVTSPTTVTLTWSSPDAAGTIAESYQIRWQEGDLSDLTWDDAHVIDDPPLPNAPDDPQDLWVLELPSNLTLAFAVRYTLGSGVSDLSNVAVVNMPSAPAAPDSCIYVPAGSFTMGSPTDEIGRTDDEAQHLVTISQGFFLTRYEITQADYEAITGDNPSIFLQESKPVNNVDFVDAVTYCNLRSVADGLTAVYTIDGDDVTWDREADGWRLPTEAEWEYACRAGSDDALAGGSLAVLACDLDYILDQFGVYCGNDTNDDDDINDDDPAPGTRVVGGYRYNAWGLYDMHGNVQEWCWDWYQSDLSAMLIDPAGPESGAVKVRRGGAWNSQAQFCRSAKRVYHNPTLTNNTVGFRVARNAPW